MRVIDTDVVIDSNVFFFYVIYLMQKNIVAVCIQQSITSFRIACPIKKVSSTLSPFYLVLPSTHSPPSLPKRIGKNRSKRIEEQLRKERSENNGRKSYERERKKKKRQI